MSPEILKSQEKPKESIPQSTRNLLDGILNDVGVREHLAGSPLFTKSVAEEWDKNIEDRMARLNQEIADNHLTRDQIMQYLQETETKESTEGGNTLYSNLRRRFWIDEYFESPTLQINHFFRLDGNLARAQLSHNVNGGNDETAELFLNELNTAIENLHPQPVAGEIERWVKAAGISHMFDVASNKLIRKRTASE